MNDDIFIPSEDSVMHYQEQLAALLKSNGSKAETIDMGRLTEIYTMLGIADKQLKTNGKTILKALGIEGRNKHNVPMETVENLLFLTYDPEAVFKSLSVSNNPGAYIAVLNAKTEDHEKIIAILSPSKDGQGFTFIPSVYEKHNFDRFLSKIYEEQKVLYIKNKGSEIWGQLQSLPRHNSEPSITNIPAKNDIVKQISGKEQIMTEADQKKLDRANQIINERAEVQEDGTLRISSKDWREINRKLNEGKPGFENIFNKISEVNEEIKAETVAMQKHGKTPPPERRNINSKEKSMPENTYTPRTNQPTKEDEAVFHKTLHERKVIMEALKNGTLSCLPGPNGYADTAPAFNLMSDKNYHGNTLLYIKEHQKQNGYPTAEYITEHQIEKAKQDYPEIALKEGQKPVSFYTHELNNETQHFEPKEIQVFNIDQTTNPQLLTNWVIEQEEKKIEMMKTQFSESYNPTEPKQKAPVPYAINCSSTDPEKYLGQYLAAVSLGTNFKVSPEQAAEFTQKLESSVYERGENGHTNPFKLGKISSAANEECRNVLRDIKMDTLKQQREQTQQQEQTQSRGRGM